MDSDAPNPNTELARERNRAAAERTLMAWIRTSLALITFGFGIDRLVVSMREGGAPGDHDELSRWFALSFILLGVLAAVVAMIEHYRVLQALKSAAFRYEPRWSLAMAVGTGLVIIGGGVFVAVLLRI